jgi:hypothetical protein
MSDAPVTLEFLARQMALLLDEIATFRDDLKKLTTHLERRVEKLEGL